MKGIDMMMQDLSSLCADMDSFCDIYREDPSVWQGDAAAEEACYVTSDIGEFRKTAEEMKNRLDLLAEKTCGEER